MQTIINLKDKLVLALAQAAAAEEIDIEELIQDTLEAKFLTKERRTSDYLNGVAVHVLTIFEQAAPTQELFVLTDLAARAGVDMADLHPSDRKVLGRRFGTLVKDSSKVMAAGKTVTNAVRYGHIRP